MSRKDLALRFAAFVLGLALAGGGGYLIGLAIYIYESLSTEAGPFTFYAGAVGISALGSGLFLMGWALLGRKGRRRRPPRS